MSWTPVTAPRLIVRPSMMQASIWTSPSLFKLNFVSLWRKWSAQTLSELRRSLRWNRRWVPCSGWLLRLRPERSPSPSKSSIRLALHEWCREIFLRTLNQIFKSDLRKLSECGFYSALSDTPSTAMNQNLGKSISAWTSMKLIRYLRSARLQQRVLNAQGRQAK